jgi:hypothetical protein
MRRVISLFVVAVVVLTAFLFDPRPGSGCHGTCQLSNMISVPLVSKPDVDLNAFIVRSLQETPPVFSQEEKTQCKVGPGTPGEVEAQLLGYEIDKEQNRQLCLIDIHFLIAGAISDSAVYLPEDAVFYIRSGEIDFTVDPALSGDFNGKDVGFVRAVPKNGEETTGLEDQGDGSFKAEQGDQFHLKEGSSIALDSQTDLMVLKYQSSGGEADMLIASAPLTTEPDPVPPGTPEATPAP